MAYIGSSASPLPVNFSAVQGQSFSGTGAQVAFTLNRSVASPVAIEVLVNNVQQSPYDGSFTVSGSTLTFSEAPSLGTNNIYVIYRDQSIGTLTDLTAYRKAEVDALLATKMPVNGPAFLAFQSAPTSIVSATSTKVLFGNEVFDTNSNFASSRFTPTVAGYYQINANVTIDQPGNASNIISLFKNGVEYMRGGRLYATTTSIAGLSVSAVIYMNGSTDYVEVYFFTNNGTCNTESGASSHFSGALIRSAT